MHAHAHKRNKKNSLLSICSSWYCLHMLVSCAFGRSGQSQVWWLISECLSFSCISFSRSLISFFVCKMHSRQKSLFISVTAKCLRIESSFFRRRSFSSLLCHVSLTRRKQVEKTKWELKWQAAVHTEVMFIFQGQNWSLLFFWCFMKAAVSKVNISKCQLMICTTGYDPKKIRHAMLVSCRKNG